MKVILMIVMALCMAYLMYALIDIMRLESIRESRIKIIEAIHDYNEDMIDAGEYDKLLPFDLLTDLDDDLKKWNCGYKHMLPDWALELVKPYIK